MTILTYSEIIPVAFIQSLAEIALISFKYACFYLLSELSQFGWLSFSSSFTDLELLKNIERLVYFTLAYGKFLLSWIDFEVSHFFNFGFLLLWMCSILTLTSEVFISSSPLRSYSFYKLFSKNCLNLKVYSIWRSIKFKQLFLATINIIPIYLRCE